MRTFKALVVDDEAAVRMLTIRELSRNGFTCDGACNGLSAQNLIAATRYDVVVTDLHMPEMNGHALAIELLSRPQRPVVVVLTGVTEPTLAKDLIARGVDDIIFKPIDQSVLAAKVRALVDQRASPPPRRPGPLRNPELKPAVLPMRVPLSQTAGDVLEMIRTGSFNTRQVTAAIEHNPPFATAVLKVANSQFYNPTSQKVVVLEEALVRIGLERMGEIALAMSIPGPYRPKCG